jgi:hypothetical protein
MGILVHVKTKSREPNSSFQPVEVGNVPENVGLNEFSSSLSLIGRANKFIRTNGSWNQVGVLCNRIMRNDGSWNQCRVCGSLILVRTSGFCFLKIFRISEPPVLVL